MNTWHVYLVIDDRNPEVGLWCSVCNLPSGIKFPILSISMEGVGQAGQWTGCLNCEGYEDDEDGDTEADLAGC